MSFILTSIVLIGITLPDPSIVHTIRSGDSCPIVYEDGEAWIGVFESEYNFLRVFTDSPCRLRAFDVNGDLCAISCNGEDLVLSAFSDYRFYIQADNPAGATDSVVFYVSDVLPDSIAAGETAAGVIGQDMMGFIYRFIPPETGEWTFQIEGPDDVDFDLEIYGADLYSTWGIGIGPTSTELVTVSAVEGETVFIIIDKVYDKQEGDVSLLIEQTGDFPGFTGSQLSMSGKIGIGEVERILIPAHRETPFYFRIDSGSDADLDVYLVDSAGETLVSSIDYGSRETFIIPPGNEELLVEVYAYYQSASVGYEMTLIPLEEVYSETFTEKPFELTSDSCTLIGFSSETSGFYRISADFTEFKDPNLDIFRNNGEEILNLSSERRYPEILLYVAESDTVWLNPYLPDYMRKVSATTYITVTEFTEPPLATNEYADIITTDSPTAMFIVNADSNAVLDITLYGEREDVDLDMFVTGPGTDISATGMKTSVDAAGHETVAVYSANVNQYAVTIYLWDKEGETPYTLSTRNLASVSLAEPSPEEEIWVLVVGLSDYPGSVDDLNRASMDAIEFYSFIIEEQGIPYSQTILLVDEMATLDAFQDAFTDILSVAGPEDVVVLSFSGHGSQEGIWTGGIEEEDFINEVLCLYDGDITDDRLSGIVESGSGCPVIIYLDACFSGGFVNDFSLGSNTQILTAAREDLSVYERVFMPILLNGVTGSADEDSNGYVSTLELLKYINMELKRVCPECAAILGEDEIICPECNTVFKEDNPIPRPQQGYYLEEDIELWQVNSDEGE